MTNSKKSTPPRAKKSSISKRITISYYQSCGESNLTLLFIHGLGSSKEDFFSIFAYRDLTANNILIPDLVGHGDSSRPSNFSYLMADQADILRQLLDTLSVRNSIVLIAHSMGGPIAVSLAELLGRRVIGMIYAEGNIDEGDCFFSKTIIDSFSKGDWEARGFDRFLIKLQNNQETKAFADTFAKAGPVAVYDSARDLYSISKEDALLMRLVQLSIPVLGIFGAKNRGKFSSEEKLSSQFPVRFIPGAGHAMMHDNPDLFYKTVSEFIHDLSY